MKQETQSVEIQIPGILGSVTFQVPLPKPKGPHRLGIKESKLPKGKGALT
jgi:hypothetical protein